MKETKQNNLAETNKFIILHLHIFISQKQNILDIAIKSVNLKL